MSGSKILIVILAVVVIAAIAVGAWFIFGKNKTGETATEVEGPPDLPVPTVVGTPRPTDPGMEGGGGDPTPTATLSIVATAQAAVEDQGIDLEDPPSMQELLDKYPELAELIQNLDLGADQEQLEKVYNQLLALYEKEGLDGLHQFMLETGLLDALNLDSAYLDFVLAYEEGGEEAARELARQRGLLTKDDELRMVLILDTEDTSVLDPQLELLEARILDAYKNEVEVAIPLDKLMEMGSSQDSLLQLVALIQNEHVVGARAPELIVPGAMPARDEGPGVTGAEAWHAAGLTGAGVKVGIIDPDGFQGFLNLLGNELPSSDHVWISSDTDQNFLNNDTGPHGTACAEVVHEMAPGADLYLAYSAGTDRGLGRAIDWLLSNDVDIISYSGRQPGGGDGRHRPRRRADPAGDQPRRPVGQLVGQLCRGASHHDLYR